MSTYISKYAPLKVEALAKKPRVSLAALQCTAERAGMSYGVFTQRLTADDEERRTNVPEEITTIASLMAWLNEKAEEITQ